VSDASAHRLAIPEIKAMRELRHALAAGGMPALDKRTPADSARIAGFRLLVELLRLYERFRRRVEAGERCRIVERERPREADRLILELEIEGQP